MKVFAERPLRAPLSVSAEASVAREVAGSRVLDTGANCAKQRVLCFSSERQHDQDFQKQDHVLLLLFFS